MNNIKRFIESNRKVHECHHTVKYAIFSVDDVVNVQALQASIVELSIRQQNIVCTSNNERCNNPAMLRLLRGLDNPILYVLRLLNMATL